MFQQTFSKIRFISALKVLKEWLLPSLNMNRRLWPLLLSVSYIVLIYFLGGLRPDHIGMASLALLDSYNEKSRLFLRLFFPFMLTGIIFDSMRYFYWQGVSGRIHITEPYLLDKTFFGVSWNGHRFTANEFWDQFQFLWADLLCGFAYLTYILEYLIPTFILFFFGQKNLVKFLAYAFLLVSLLGFLTYFIYPAAPPWYISKYGFGPARMDAIPDMAAAARFDAFCGTHFFSQMYGRGIDVFGAYPSLHVSYPLIIAWLSIYLKKLRWLGVSFYLLMCFSAIYLQHHYVMDVILGTLYASLIVLVLWFFHLSKCERPR